MKNKLGPRVLLSVIGAALILLGSGYLILGVVGERASAIVTSVRREGGERSDSKPGRYTYVIGYTLSLPDGREADGSSRRISDGAYLKADGTSRISVRYMKSLPMINAAEKDTELSIGQPILILTGAFLIVIINRKKKPVQRHHKKER